MRKKKKKKTSTAIKKHPICVESVSEAKYCPKQLIFKFLSQDSAAVFIFPFLKGRYYLLDATSLGSL